MYNSKYNSTFTFLTASYLALTMGQWGCGGEDKPKTAGFSENTAESLATNPIDLTANATIIARITNPTGGGSRNLEVIRDGVYPARGSIDSSQQYDTYTGTTRTEDWIGYQFSSNQTFGSIVFQSGKQFGDGGWFINLKVQVRQDGTWVDAQGLSVTPAFAGHDGINFETYTLNFPAIAGDAIRIDGTPGGTETFISVGELRVFSNSSAASPPPTANAGVNQSVTAGQFVTLDGSGSSDPKGATLTYAWAQTGGPAVTLSNSTAQKPTFTAPSVSSSTSLIFSLVVRNATSSSAASTLTVSVSPRGAPASCGSGICVRQTAEVTHGDDNPEKDVLPFGQPVLAGSTVIVFAYDMNINGNPIASGTPYPIVITDSANGTYKKLIMVNDPIGWADNQVFARTNVNAGTLTVTGAWMTNQWHSLIIVEVANVSANPSLTAAGVLNVSASTNQDAVSSGTLGLNASPALLLGYAVNNIDSVGEAGAPWAGTGFTTVTTGANWQGKEGTSSNPAAILESAYFATGGTVAATFTSKKPVGSNDNFVAIGIAVQ